MGKPIRGGPMRPSLIALLLLFLPLSTQALADENYGPFKAKVGDMAELDVPQGYRWIGKDHIAELMKSLGNIRGPNELGAVSTEPGDKWFELCGFEYVGYIQ